LGIVALAALSSSQANMVGIALGLIVGVILDIWLVALLWPAFTGAGMPAVAKVSTNLVGMLATAAGSKWASEAILSKVDYSQIVAPYYLTVAIVFVSFGLAVLAILVARVARNPRPT
jgi:hypothetical protein